MVLSYKLPLKTSYGQQSSVPFFSLHLEFISFCLTLWLAVDKIVCQFYEGMDCVIVSPSPQELSTVPSIQLGFVKIERILGCGRTHLEKTFSSIIDGMRFLSSIYFDPMPW